MTDIVHTDSNTDSNTNSNTDSNTDSNVDYPMINIVQKLDEYNFSSGIYQMLNYYFENYSKPVLDIFYQELFIVTRQDLQILNFNRWVLNRSNHRLNEQLVFKLNSEQSSSGLRLVPKYRNCYYGTICLLKCILQFIGLDNQKIRMIYCSADKIELEKNIDNKLIYVDFKQDIRKVRSVVKKLDSKRRLERSVALFSKKVIGQCNKIYELQSQISDAYEKCSMLNIFSESELLYYSAEFTKIFFDFFLGFKQLLKYSSNDLVKKFKNTLKNNLSQTIGYCSGYDSHFVYTVECMYSKLVRPNYEPSLNSLFKEKECCCFSDITYRCTFEELAKFIKLAYVGCDCEDVGAHFEQVAVEFDEIDESEGIFNYDSSEFNPMIRTLDQQERVNHVDECDAM